MTLRLRVDPEIDEGRLDDITSRLQGLFGGAGESSGSSFGAGLLSGLTGGSRALSGITEVAAGMGAGISAGAAVATGGIAAIGVAAVAAGQQLYQIGESFDAVGDSIAFRTGKLGDDLDTLTQSMHNVASETASSFAEIGDILGQVSVGLGLTGEPLEDLTKQIADLNRMSGATTDIRDLSQLVAVFGQDATAASADLDNLYAATQQALIPFDALLDSVVKAGPAAQTLGLSLDQVIGLMVLFEKAGVDTNRTYMALNNAAKVFADSNIDLKTGLRDTIIQVQQLLDTGRDAEAVDLLGRIFNEKQGQAFLKLLRDGDLTVDTLDEGLKNTGSTIDEMSKKTSDWAEQWDILKKKIESALAPVAEFTFESINTYLDFMTGGHGTPWPGGTTAQPPSQVTPGPQQPLPPGMLSPPGAPGGMTLPPGPLPSTAPDVGGVPGQTSPPPFTVPLPPPAPPPGSPDDILGKINAGNKPGGSSPGAPAIPFPAEYGQPLRPGETLEDWQKRQRLMEAEHDLAEKRAALTQLEATRNDQDQDNNATADEITRANNNIAQAEARVYTIEQQNLQKRQQILDAVQVPYPAGYGQMPRPGETAEQYGREQAAYEAVHKRQEAEARLAQVQSDATKNQNDVVKAANDLAAARQNEIQAMLRLTESGSKAADQLTEVGAKLDADFGLSEGLPGLAENLFKFLANLAAAPVLGALGAVSVAGGGENAGSGLMGLLGASGAFGPQFQLGAQTGLPALSAGSPSGVYSGLQGLAQQALQSAAQPYGLPAGTNIGKGKAGFPDWVYNLGAQFGLKPSTYAGHQESSRPDIGAAPNLQGLNRGIDWWGSPQDLQQFAQFLDATGLAEQVIYQNPETGQQFGYPSGVNYAGDYGQHTDHLHSRFSQSVPGMSSGIRAQPGRTSQTAGMMPGLNPGEQAAYSAMINAGFSPSEWPALQQILSHESGANPTARNPSSGAYGMFQFLGHENDKYGALGAYSPSASQQSVAGMAYIQDRYGSPTNAWNFWQANNWYQSGGGVPGYGGGDTVPALLEGGEYVLPKEDVSAMGGPAGVASMRAGLKGPTRIGGIYPQGGTGSGFRLGEGWAGDLLSTAIQQGLGFQQGGLVVDPFNPQGPPPGPPPGQQPSIAFTPQGPLPGPDFSVFNPQGPPPGPQPHAGPTRIGGAETNFGIGAGSGAGGTGFGNTGVSGEAIGAAIGAGATALDALAPGAGQAAAIAANIAIKLITRAVGAGAQAVGAGAQGLLETFLPTGGSQLASSNWLTRIAGGFAGAHPTLPNTAGMSQNKPATQEGPPPNPLAPATRTVAPPPQPIAYVPQGPPPGPTKEQGPMVNIENVNNYGPEDSTGLRISEHVRAAYSGATSALSGGR